MLKIDVPLLLANCQNVERSWNSDCQGQQLSSCDLGHRLVIPLIKSQDSDLGTSFFQTPFLMKVFVLPELRNARPATRIQNPERPRKKLKKLPPGPRPQILKKAQKTLKAPENSILCVILVCLSFFQGIWGRGPGVIFEFFSRIFGFRGFGSL